ncbi:hypothetical protein [Sorangium sp. So ce1000]|uniref:hypothetical protein n=1 Tax=Sorangium sp. So ce1000 TaxID=3133325 RepID=UPI003F62808F
MKQPSSSMPSVSGSLIVESFGLKWKLGADSSIEVTVVTMGLLYSGPSTASLTPQEPQFTTSGSCTLRGVGLPLAYLDMSARVDFSRRQLIASWQVRNSAGERISAFEGVVGSWNTTGA